MRRALLLVGFLSACGIFPSLDDLQGGTDASPDVVQDAAQDAVVVQDSGVDADAAVCGFPVGPTTGLVAYYDFDEGLVAHDCTANQLDGTFVRQDVGAWVTGKHGSAVRLGAPTGCIELGSSPLLVFTSSLTVAAWIDVATYPTSTNLGYIFAKGNAINTTGYRFGLEPSVMLGIKIGSTSDAGAFSLTGSGPAAADWHQVAWTFDTGKSSIYVDGTVMSGTISAPSAIVDDPSSTLTVGCHPGSTTFPFQGVIDEMRIWNRALTPSEVASLVQ